MQLLKKILSQPTAPFREKQVMFTITSEFKKAGVPHFTDPVGNVIVGVANPKEYAKLVHLKTKEPLRVFMAHMDHPGFHGVSWKSKTKLEIKWHGGSPTKHLVGANVWLANENGWLNGNSGAAGKVVSAKLIPSGRAIDSMTIKLTTKANQSSDGETPRAESLYGGFAFHAPVWQEGDCLYTKGADDLGGCYAISTAAIELWKKSHKKSNHNFLALLTRAEEVGYIGAIGHFELGWLKDAKRPVLCISLETSRTFPGAELGKGPVVRLGDKTSVFDSGALRVFLDLAQAVLPGKHQRRIMDGGSCEATAALAYGFLAVGISAPLGNYHNQSIEGGLESRGPNGPAPEFINIQDLKGMVKLCVALMKPNLPWENPWKKTQAKLQKEFRGYRRLLQSI